MPERWLPVVGSPGYEISDMGRVRSPRGPLAGRPGGDGYPYVSLGRGRQAKVHTLVLTTFVGPRPSGMECRHLDDNPLNSALTNLRWGTRGENIRDRVRLGTHYETARTTCLRDHQLVAPNLVPSSLPRRGCLACSRGSTTVRHARQRHGVTLDLQAESDRHYERINGSVINESDPVARDVHGAPLSAGELCQREGCWHRWFEHDHINADLGDAGFGWCMIVDSEGRCGCLGFVAAADAPVVAPSPFAAPFPTAPTRADVT